MWSCTVAMTCHAMELHISCYAIELYSSCVRSFSAITGHCADYGCDPKAQQSHLVTADPQNRGMLPLYYYACYAPSTASIPTWPEPNITLNGTEPRPWRYLVNKYAIHMHMPTGL